jgi:hypothetical protein
MKDAYKKQASLLYQISPRENKRTINETNPGNQFYRSSQSRRRAEIDMHYL